MTTLLMKDAQYTDVFCSLALAIRDLQNQGGNPSPLQQLA
jgi:hypothetical protein